jgi:hypothetical protein
MALEAEFKWFLDHQDELVTKYEGKYVVIKDGGVLGAYETQLKRSGNRSRQGTRLEHSLCNSALPGMPATRRHSTRW